MKRNISIVLGLLLAVAAQQVRAQDQEPPDPGFKAEALKEACDPPPALDQNAKDQAAKLCQAYLRGVADGLFMLQTMQQSGPICLPDDGPVSPAEAKAELEDYLSDHPEAAQRSAGVAATFAILAAHPCE